MFKIQMAKRITDYYFQKSHKEKQLKLNIFTSQSLVQSAETIYTSQSLVTYIKPSN